MKNKKNRSIQQNKALHKWFDQLSKALNEDGFDMRTVISEEIDIPWSHYTVKEHLWRPVQKTLYNIESTKNINTQEINKIYDIINKTVGERTGIHVPFPNIEELMNSCG